MRLGTAGLLMVALGLVACGRAEPIPVSVETSVVEGTTRIVLVPDSGYRINARVLPALELRDGPVLLFPAPDDPADSAYYQSPPLLQSERPLRDLRGVVRTSVCEVETGYCRVIEVEL